MRYLLRCLLIVLLGLMALPTGVLAHEGQPPAPHDLWQAWNWELSLVLGLALAGWLYLRGVVRLWRRAGVGGGARRRQVAAFAGGLLALFVALISPLDALGAALFSAHMAQHLLLMLAAAPLLVLASPLVPFLWALPRPVRLGLGPWWRGQAALRGAWGIVSAPGPAWAISAAALWGWHLPGPYQAALASEALHTLEHAMFLGTALVFWWAMLHPRGQRGHGYGASVLYVFTTALHGSILGALMTFSPVPWYPAYHASVSAWGLTPLEDQQLAGVIMWVPAGVIYVLAAILLLAGWLRALEQESSRSRRSW